MKTLDNQMWLMSDASLQHYRTMEGTVVFDKNVYLIEGKIRTTEASRKDSAELLSVPISQKQPRHDNA